MDWIPKLDVLKLTPIDGNSFSPLTQDEIINIERSIGARLPEQYRVFLGHFGASDFEEYAVFPTKGGGVAPGRFFGRDLLSAIDEYAERLPQLIVPINEDPAANLICLSVRKDSFGTVFYQSHSEGIGDFHGPPAGLDAEKSKTLVRLASDFSNFILGLEPG